MKKKKKELERWTYIVKEEKEIGGFNINNY